MPKDEPDITKAEDRREVLDKLRILSNEVSSTTKQLRFAPNPEKILGGALALIEELSTYIGALTEMLIQVDRELQDKAPRSHIHSHYQPKEHL